LPNLILPLLDLNNVLCIDVVGAVYSDSYLIDVACDIADKSVEFLQLVLADMNDISLKDHRSDKLAP